MQEIARQQELKGQQKRQQLPENALVIDLPQAAKKAELDDEFLKGASDLLQNGLAIAAGVPAGFMGTKLLYDQWKKKQTDGEIATANQKYLQALQTAGQKEASTPNVDAFCSAVGAALDKEASAGGAAKELWHNFSSQFPKSNGGKAALGLGAGVLGAGGASFAHDFTPGTNPGPNVLSQFGGALGDSWKALEILSALGTGGAMMHASNKADDKSKPNIPSAVAVNYQPIHGESQPSL